MRGILREDSGFHRCNLAKQKSLRYNTCSGGYVPITILDSSTCFPTFLEQ